MFSILLPSPSALPENVRYLTTIDFLFGWHVGLIIEFILSPEYHNNGFLLKERYNTMLTERFLEIENMDPEDYERQALEIYDAMLEEHVVPAINNFTLLLQNYVGCAHMFNQANSESILSTEISLGVDNGSVLEITFLGRPEDILAPALASNVARPMHI